MVLLWLLVVFRLKVAGAGAQHRKNCQITVVVVCLQCGLGCLSQVPKTLLHHKRTLSLAHQESLFLLNLGRRSGSRNSNQMLTNAPVNATITICSCYSNTLHSKRLQFRHLSCCCCCCQRGNQNAIAGTTPHCQRERCGCQAARQAYGQTDSSLTRR